MGRRRRGRKSRARAAAVTKSRGNAANRGAAVKRAQKAVNKQATVGTTPVANANGNFSFNGGTPAQRASSQNQRKVDVATNGLGRQVTPQQGRAKPNGGAGGKGAQEGLQERFTKAKAGRGRGKGSRPIQESQQQMDGGGFRNRGYGMGREQRGYGMGKEKPNFGGNTAFGMGRDQRAAGMGSQEMMRNRGYNSGMDSSVRPSKGSMQPIKQPEGRPMDPSSERISQAPTSPRASRGRSSFNPASGRMEYTSQPNNFSRSSQRPTSRMFGGFRKNMGTTQGAFKLPAKSQIKK